MVERGPIMLRGTLSRVANKNHIVIRRRHSTTRSCSRTVESGPFLLFSEATMPPTPLMIVNPTSHYSPRSSLHLVAIDTRSTLQTSSISYNPTSQIICRTQETDPRGARPLCPSPLAILPVGNRSAHTPTLPTLPIPPHPCNRHGIHPRLVGGW